MLQNLRDRFVAELRPTPPAVVPRRLVIGAIAGAMTSIVLVIVLMGLRPDMARATLSYMFWFKLAYTSALAAFALWSAERLARPGAAGLWELLWIAAPLVLVVALAVWQLCWAPEPMRKQMIMGDSSKVCSWCIVVFSIPPLLGLIWAMRGLAPTNLPRAGAVIGLASGGFGASAYALHCTEVTAPFLAIWYTFGVATAGGIGAVLGPRVLRW
ncbi:MAG: DUF1109 domain-containing protein [Caulobacteraceae bacterium]